MLQQKFVDLFARSSGVVLPIAERDVALTYVLRILADAGLLNQLIFKGGRGAVQPDCETSDRAFTLKLTVQQ